MKSSNVKRFFIMRLNIKQDTFLSAWVICGLASFFALFQFAIQTSPSVMVPQLMKFFNIDTLGIGIFSSSYFYTYLILQVPVGILVDKYGPRRLMNISIILCTLACLLFSFAGSYWIAVSARLLMGLASAPAFSCALYLCVRWFPPAMFAFVAGLVESVGMVGGAAGEIFLSHIVESSWGWQGAMVTCALVGLLLAILVAIIVKDGPEESKKPLDSLLGQLSSHKFKLVTLLTPVIFNKQVWINGLYSGLVFMIISGFASLWSVPFLQTLYEIDVIHSAFISSFIFLGAAFGAPAYGWISGKLGLRKPLMIWCVLLTLVLSCWIIYFPPTAMIGMLILYWFFGFFSGGYMLPFAAVRDITPSFSQGTAMAFTNMMNILFGAPLFQPLTGLILNRIGIPSENGEVIFTVFNYQTAFILMPIGLLIASGLSFLIKETCHSEKK